MTLWVIEDDDEWEGVYATQPWKQVLFYVQYDMKDSILPDDAFYEWKPNEYIDIDNDIGYRLSKYPKEDTKEIWIQFMKDILNYGVGVKK